VNLPVWCRSRSAQDAGRHADRLRGSLEVAASEKQQLERMRAALIEQLDAMNAETQRLQSANSDLQRSRDQLEDEKDDLRKDLQRQVKENERWYDGISVAYMLH
jgi:predicted nuclease with TOPRIM domain